MPCSQQHPINFILLREVMRNGRICRNPVQQLHASVNHRMVQCVRPAAKIITDFTSIDFEAVKIGCPCTARYGKTDLVYAGFAYRPPIQRQILHAAVKYSTVRTSKSGFLGWNQKQPYRVYGVYGCFEVRFSFSIRQRIDYLNAHKAPHPLAADVDIVGGLHIVKPLILRKLRADPVGRHGLLCVIVAPSCVGFIDRLGAGFAVCPKADIALGLQKLDRKSVV